MTLQFVDLGRTFQPFGGPDGAVRAARWLDPSHGTFSWADVLQRERVMVLATASSGKTEEFRAQARSLVSSSRAAFFVPIRSFANASIEVLLQPDYALFQQWLAGDEPAWFFLDSVDEAKLLRHDVNLAWGKLAHALGRAGQQRARILVSGRPDENWERDRDDFARILPPPPSGQAASRSAVTPQAPEPDQVLLEPIRRSLPPTPRQRRDEGAVVGKSTDHDRSPLVLELTPLTLEQQKRLAGAAGVAEPGELLESMQRLGRDLYAETPGELLDFATYWTGHGNRLGTRQEILEHRVTRRLAEASRGRPDDDTLTPEQARHGAERLAAALTLTKSTTLHVATGLPCAETLDARAIFSQWTDAQREALLRRAAFALDTFGYRFHHRSTQEYLCASWLRRIASASTSGDAALLLSSDTHGVQTLVPSLRAAAAWLALWDEHVRDEIINREPMELLREGDPQSLPLTAKKRILLSCARKHVNGEISSFVLDYRRLRLFAESGLAESVREAWGINSAWKFRIILLCIVRDAPIGECVDLAQESALDSTQPDDLRVVALEAIAACGDTHTLGQVAAKLKADPNVPTAYASQAAAVLFPQHLDVDALLVLIEASFAQHEDRPGFGSVFRHLWEACRSAGEREALAFGLVVLMRRAGFARSGDPEFRHGVLVTQIGEIVCEELERLAVGAEAAKWVVPLSCVAARAGALSGASLRRLRSCVSKHAVLKQEAFAYDVRDLIETQRPSFWSLDRDHAAWQLDEADLTWLLQSVATGEVSARRVALQAAIWVLRGIGRFESQLERLQRLVCGCSELEEELRSFVAVERTHEANPDLEQVRLEMAASQARAQAEWLQFAQQLRGDPAILVRDADSTPPQTGKLNCVTHWLTLTTGNLPWDAARSWERVGAAFSPEVAESYVNAMNLLWRRVEPARPSREPGHPVCISKEQELALAGLAIAAARDPEWASTLTAADAARAASHACMAEWNLPDWVEPLVAMHARAVLPTLLRCLRFEWSARETHPLSLLHDVAEGKREPHVLLLSRLSRLVAARRPAQIRALTLIVRILRRRKLGDADAQRIAQAAKRSLESALRDDQPAWAGQYAALVLLLDSEQGAALLVGGITGRTGTDRMRLGQAMLGTLLSRSEPLLALSEIRLSINACESLVRIAYECIRPADDVERRGGYTPSARDYAQEARDQLLSHLLDQVGSEAYQAVRRLATDPAFTDRKCRFRELAHGMAERDAEIPAWRVEDVLQFERTHLIPATTGARLLRIVVGVLEEIRRSFKNEDASSRAVLANAPDEKSVQAWLLEQLQLRARERFQAWREPEVAGGRKPDIVVASTVAPCEVAIEVKRAEDWSLADLEGALQTQLVECYLRPVARRHGVLFITCSKQRDRGWQATHSQARLDFASVIEHLTANARSIDRNSSGPVEAVVIGLDASPTNQPDANKTERRSARQASDRTRRNHKHRP